MLRQGLYLRTSGLSVYQDLDVKGARHLDDLQAP